MNEIPRLETIDAEELIATPLKQVPFTVENLVGQGLYLLVGGSKIGKSWLVLWLCLQIASGKAVWNYAVREGTVLYLCLEDNLNRVQKRLMEITDTAPDTLHFSCLARDIATGLIPQMEDFMVNHPNTVMIAIDTLQKVRGDSMGNSGAYASDYKDLSALKSFADNHKITVLLVHHTSKRPHEKDDPFKQISGTTAIMGAADGCLVLTKNSVYDKKAQLAVTGRDVEQRLLTLEQEENHIWSLLEDNVGKELVKKLTPPVIFVICEFVQKMKIWSGNATELVEAIQPLISEPISQQSITTKINRHLDILDSHGIAYHTKREADKRMIYLSVVDKKEDEIRDTDTTTNHW